ncbi:MAG TPA: 16S rRNA (uracil(1498)-N(3))-methyltransferase [Candidatus Binatia bacterium]|jgi:16S rRNA (uracil1498-N3)-methyltransferase
MARFFVPKKNLRDSHGLIDGQELVHLRKVLRLVPGDRVTIFDDSGWEHEAVIRSLNAEQGEIEIVRSYEASRESPLQIILGVALTKGDKMDFIVEKATELGVQTIIPFASSYAVPQLDSTKIMKRTERWQKIALSATKQCGRTRAPEISQLWEYRKLVNGTWPQTLKLIFWEKEKHRSLYQVRDKHGDVKAVLLVIGPEGGFTAEEAQLAQRHGFETVELGRRILRADTAAVAAITLVQFLWGDLR